MAESSILSIHPDNPAQYVQVNSFFADTIYEASNTLEISKIGFAAFFTNFQTILIGNQANAQLTYDYYDVYPLDEAYLGLLSADPNLASQVPSPSPNPDFFRVTDLFLAPNEVAVIQNTDDIDQLLNTAVNLGDIDGGDDASNSAENTGGFFALNKPTSAPAAQLVTHAAHHGRSQQQLPTASDHSAENDSWIDRALVSTAIASPLALSLKPKSWLGKLADKVSRRRKMPF